VEVLVGENGASPAKREAYDPRKETRVLGVQVQEAVALHEEAHRIRWPYERQVVRVPAGTPRHAGMVEERLRRTRGLSRWRSRPEDGLKVISRAHCRADDDKQPVTKSGP